jgi:hypothetical protein
MLTITNVHDPDLSRFEGRTFTRKLVLAIDVCKAFENEEDLLDLIEVYFDETDLIGFDDDTLRFKDGRDWSQIACEFVMTPIKLSERDISYYMAWRRLMEFRYCEFDSPFDREVLEAQCTVLFQVLPRDLVGHIFKTL